MKILRTKFTFTTSTLAFLLVITSFKGNAQVGIGTTSPDPAAALEVSSSTQGLLPPRMKATERDAIANPPAGLIMWCTDCGTNGELQIFNGVDFTNILGGERAKVPRAQLGTDVDGEAAGDNFGSSVTLSSDGSILAAGAPKNNGNGSESGQVRVYEYVSGAWSQLGADIDGEAAGDIFGSAVSLSSDGSILAIGAPLNDENGSNSGHVRVYEYVSGAWTQLGSDIDGEAAEDRFGNSVSLSSDGTILAVGAWYNDGNGSNSGHVRVFKYVSGSWTQLGTDIDGEAAGDYFGKSVSISSDGSILAIGAHYNDGNGSGSGHARVYEYTSGSWTQLGTDIDGEANEDKSGFSVSLSSDGSILAIGAIANDVNGSNSGQGKVYEYSSGSWTQIGANILGEASEDACGWSVSLSANGTILALGAHRNDANGLNSGHVRVYEYVAGAWTQLDSDIDGEATEDNFGISVSLSSDGGVLGIGAPKNDGNNGSESGHVRVFTTGGL